MQVQGKVRFISKNRVSFFADLNKKVDRYFKENNLAKTANSTMVVKSIVLICLYVLPFIAFLWLQPGFWLSMLLWTMMGVGVAGIGMSVMHDANHGAYSSNKLVNKIMGHSLNLVGGSVVNWKLQHNILHHTYTNIATLDEDVQNKLVLKFNPHTDAKPIHRLQSVYAFFFYGIMTLYWAVAKDFIQYVKFMKSGLYDDTLSEYVATLIKIITNKVLYFFVFLVAPIVIFNIPAAIVITGFLMMHFTSGLILTLIFQLAHAVEGTTYPMPNQEGNIENEWAIHQLNTTANFSRHNRWLSWYVGGLNFQIEHHLFPRICHVHYPAIADIVKSTAEEHNIPYMEFPTFKKALQSHLNLLHQFGKLPKMSEAIV